MNYGTVLTTNNSVQDIAADWKFTKLACKQ